MSIAFMLHLLAAVLWVGGMFFAHVMVRPAANRLPMPKKVFFWYRVIRRFFLLVGVAVVTLPVSGYWMVFTGGVSGWEPRILLMQGLGWVMIGIYLHALVNPFRRMQGMLRERLFPEAGLYLLRIRRLMTINLTLGLLLVMAVAWGRYGSF